MPHTGQSYHSTSHTLSPAPDSTALTHTHTHTHRGEVHTSSSEQTFCFSFFLSHTLSLAPKTPFGLSVKECPQEFPDTSPTAKLLPGWQREAVVAHGRGVGSASLRLGAGGVRRRVPRRDAVALSLPTLFSLLKVLVFHIKPVRQNPQIYRNIAPLPGDQPLGNGRPTVLSDQQKTLFESDECKLSSVICLSLSLSVNPKRNETAATD